MEWIEEPIINEDDMYSIEARVPCVLNLCWDRSGTNPCGVNVCGKKFCGINY